MSYSAEEALGFLCISCDFKGIDFIKRIGALGHRVYLITAEARRPDDWPHDVITDIFYMPEEDGRLWNVDQLLAGTAHLMRSQQIDRIIALDDYDVRKAAHLREEFRTPGMGQTTARHFYDKLAMRLKAKEAGIDVPGFSALFNNAQIDAFFENSTGPWFIKPRSDAGALGIRKIESPEFFWERANTLDEDRHRFLIEEYKPGDVFHVDSLSHNGKIVFTRCSQYLFPPFDVAHGGGIFQSHTIDIDTDLDRRLKKANTRVLDAFGLMHGATHSEYILSDNKIYFLETSARVGGAHLADMVEAASGINLWAEWAQLEHAMLTGTDYTMPVPEKNHAGIVASLSNAPTADYTQFDDLEIWWTMAKKHHVGMIFKDARRERILELLDKYSRIIRDRYHATVPLKE